ncbi:MAG: hypothetical protein ABR592_06890, partial [Nitriliruptorales bacterium]
MTSVVAILAQLAEVEDLGEVCPIATGAFDRYAAGGRQSGPRSAWTRPDAALLAAVLPTAVAMLAVASSAEFDERLAPFVHCGFETRFRFFERRLPAPRRERPDDADALLEDVGPQQLGQERQVGALGGHDAKGEGAEPSAQMAPDVG